MLIAPASIHVKRFTGCVSDWSMLNNDWPIQKIDSLTSVRRSLCHSQILAFQTCKRVKLMAKV